MIHFNGFLDNPDFAQWREQFATVIEPRSNHGDLPKWLALLESLPAVTASSVELNSSSIRIGEPSDLNQRQAQQLYDALIGLAPWRKGPYQFFDTFIDTEWRSDFKWQRVQPHISKLANRRVLDVGCGTGYHGWRMLGDGAAYVLGIDPSMRFLVQFHAVQRYLNDARFDFLPIGIEDMPDDFCMFDSVFSMGVLYHRRTPINHLLELQKLLLPNGELVLETLIIDEDAHPELINGILTPQHRYAQMRNVWCIMTVEKILDLLQQAGYKNARCVDQNTTSLAEQRRTQWMSYHSLREFLDPQDISQTIEHYPAPKRGLFIAQK